MLILRNHEENIKYYEFYKLIFNANHELKTQKPTRISLCKTA